jgi:hypothetical protein
VQDTAAILAGLREAVRAQNAGLMQLMGVMASHGEMLKQILAASTAEPSDLIPDLFRQLAALAEGMEGLRESIEGLRAELRAERVR